MSTTFRCTNPNQNLSFVVPSFLNIANNVSNVQHTQINTLDTMQNVYLRNSPINNIQNTIFINEQSESSNYQKCASNTCGSGTNNAEMDVEQNENGKKIDDVRNRPVDRKMLSKIGFSKLGIRIRPTTITFTSKQATRCCFLF